MKQELSTKPLIPAESLERAHISGKVHLQRARESFKICSELLGLADKHHEFMDALQKLAAAQHVLDDLAFIFPHDEQLVNSQNEADAMKL